MKRYSAKLLFQYRAALGDNPRFGRARYRYGLGRPVSEDGRRKAVSSVREEGRVGGKHFLQHPCRTAIIQQNCSANSSRGFALAGDCLEMIEDYLLAHMT